jgi:hypothetical protein
MTRWFCHEEIATAHEEGLRCIGVMETDPRHGQPDFVQEKTRARTGGKDGAPVHDKHVEQNLALLDEVCFIPFRRQAHEVHGMVAEILRQALEAKPLKPAAVAVSAEPESEPESDPEVQAYGAHGHPPLAPAPATADSLEAFLDPWFALLKDTLDELGAEQVEDLKVLDESDIDALASKLKKVPATKFRKKLAELR